MKTKITIPLVCAFILLFSLREVKAQTLIQYWDFNNTPPAGGGAHDSLGNVTNALVANQVFAGLTPGHIIYSRPSAHFGSTGLRDSILDNGSGGAAFYDYSNSNDTGSSAAGNLFIRARNPSDSCTFTIYAPTTGFKNISMQYAISTSSSAAAQYNILSYSTDGGSTWKKLTTAMDTFNIGGVRYPDTLQVENPVTAASGWYPVQINFTSDPAVNNNPNFVLSWIIAGSNSSIGSHNDRYDNIAVWGTSVNGINELPAEAAGYNAYPNPAGDIVTIDGTYIGKKLVTIYNILGQSVVSVADDKKQVPVNISSLTSGVYFVNIKEVTTGINYTLKLVKN